MKWILTTLAYRCLVKLSESEWRFRCFVFQFEWMCMEIDVKVLYVWGTLQGRSYGYIVIIITIAKHHFTEKANILKEVRAWFSILTIKKKHQIVTLTYYLKAFWPLLTSRQLMNILSNFCLYLNKWLFYQSSVKLCLDGYFLYRKSYVLKCRRQ